MYLVTHFVNASKYLTFINLLNSPKVHCSFSTRHKERHNAKGRLWTEAGAENLEDPSHEALTSGFHNCSHNFCPQHTLCGHLAINVVSQRELINFSMFVKCQDPPETVSCQLPCAPVLKHTSHRRGGWNLLNSSFSFREAPFSTILSNCCKSTSVSVSRSDQEFQPNALR